MDVEKLNLTKIKSESKVLVLQLGPNTDTVLG